MRNLINSIIWENTTKSSRLFELCNSIAADLQKLPARPIITGNEKAFAAWLKPDHCALLRQATREELSDYLDVEPKPLSVFSHREPSELLVLAILQLEKSDLNIKVLESLAGLCVGAAKQRLRITPHFTNPDQQGRRVEFIGSNEVPRALDTMCKVWNDRHQAETAIQTALWIFVAILNAHAFKDGNGRLARALLNSYLIKSNILTHGPLPLGPLIYACQGNFELALRRVEITNDWLPLFDVFHKIIQIYSAFIVEFEQIETSPI
jgi:Fic/DOC family